MYYLEILLLAICTGLVAAVYRGVLAYEPILNWWFKIGDRYEKKWFYKPIWGCIRCIAGQFGLWGFVFLEAIPGHPGANPFAYFAGLVTAICVSILVGMVGIKVTDRVK
jgi:hypothetical protein